MTLTPEEFNKLTTKDDFSRLESKVDNLTDVVMQILTTLDSSTKRYKDVDTELASNQVAHDRFESRITNLENTVLTK